jgi:hypothetical protein
MTLWAAKACYRDSFNILNAGNVRTSQEIYLWPPRTVTGIDLFFYV